MPTSQILVSKLQKFFTDRGQRKAVVGLSGGVDSATTLVLAVRALGPENVFGLILPRKNISSDESKILAEQVAQKFGVKTFEFEIGEIIEKFTPAWSQNHLAEINLAPRIRMTALYNFANSQDCLVLGTSNKSEILLGYGTKFGDFAADLEVLGSLFKTEVFVLAKELEVPDEIIKRAPTAELHPDQTDESELGASYQVLDEILQKLEKNNFELPSNTTGLEKSILERVLQNKHKTELTPIL